MSMRRIGKGYANTPDEVRETVAAALALVAELDVPDDLRVSAFTEAVRLFSASQTVYEQVQASGLGLAVPRG